MMSIEQQSEKTVAPLRRPWWIYGAAALAMAGCGHAESGLPPSDPHATVANPHVRSDYNIKTCDIQKNTLFMNCQPRVPGMYKLFEGSYKNPDNPPKDTVIVQTVSGPFTFAPEDTSQPHCTKGYITLTLPNAPTEEPYQVYDFDICSADR